MTARTPEETHALLAQAFNDLDLEAFVDVYADDAVLIVPPDGQRVSGRDAIRRALVPTFALKPTAEIEVVQKLESDGVALTQARWHIEGTGEAGQPVRLSGNGSIVSRRQPDGSWRIVLDNPLGLS
jgi:uncharacterized protein (TIGR02246 family)